VFWKVSKKCAFSLRYYRNLKVWLLLRNTCLGSLYIYCEVSFCLSNIRVWFTQTGRDNLYTPKLGSVIYVYRILLKPVQCQSVTHKLPSLCPVSLCRLLSSTVGTLPESTLQPTVWMPCVIVYTAGIQGLSSTCQYLTIYFQPVDCQYNLENVHCLAVLQTVQSVHCLSVSHNENLSIVR